jgi:hypothetical protein
MSPQLMACDTTIMELGYAMAHLPPGAVVDFNDVGLLKLVIEEAHKTFAANAGSPTASPTRNSESDRGSDSDSDSESDSNTEAGSAGSSSENGTLASFGLGQRRRLMMVEDTST